MLAVCFGFDSLCPTLLGVGLAGQPSLVIWWDLLVDRCGVLVLGMGVSAELELGSERSGMWGFERVLIGFVAELGRRPPPQGSTMLNPIYIVWGGSAGGKHRGGADLSV